MLVYARIKTALESFAKETRGSFTVEAVITIPLLFWGIAATYEFFEVHRYKSVREKATYTVADMISRETREEGLNVAYLDNAMTLFNEMSNDTGTNLMRVSVVQYDEINDIYEVVWSQLRGTGTTLDPLETDDVRNAHDTLPIVDNGDQIILVESNSFYEPFLGLALDRFLVDTRMFTAIRFASQVCYEGVCGPDDGTPPDASDDDDSTANNNDGGT
ncbi:TadE/TadG family type IV pilus assembly protein [Roseovarius rhodophyticola]|uniref:Pilus assembly protein n=1 Tax=Roseovarius rhodophyticola TaxID=3080827 RepID=A0ABZ2TC74_9RHOB|nr:pilus assembly protein [Roseovarius sp. W115]MDV2931042.1 pilus assembly protein [Roseovarius sp. W115]